jgi:hypothetical protein
MLRDVLWEYHRFSGKEDSTKAKPTRLGEANRAKPSNKLGFFSMPILSLAKIAPTGSDRGAEGKPET